jgi:photosystem II stability/assembly factor-like uncharacterized protein
MSDTRWLVPLFLLPSLLTACDEPLSIPLEPSPVVRVEGWPKSIFADLNSLAFSPDGQHGIAVGASDIMLETKDGGATWHSVALSDGTDLNFVAYFSTTNYSAFIASGDRNQVRYLEEPDGEIEYTSDGIRSAAISARNKEEAFWIPSDGKSLRRGHETVSLPAFDGKSNDELVGLVFSRDGLLGWTISKSGKVFSTSDAGQNWRAGSIAADFSPIGIAVTPDGRNTWVVGSDGRIYSVSQPSDHWSLRLSAGSALAAVAASGDNQHGIAVGTNGNVFHTSDAGKTWLRGDSSSNQDLRAIAFSGRAAWAVGRGGLLLASADYGATWSPKTGVPQHLPADDDFRGFTLDDVTGVSSAASAVWATIEGTIFKRTLVTIHGRPRTARRRGS